MIAAAGAGRFVPGERLYHFFRKEAPLLPDVSNVNLNRTWAADYHPQVITDYLRVSPTGPLAPLVFTLTTLGRRLTLSLTYRPVLLDEQMASQLATIFLDRLASRYHVFSPELPGYGESTGEELLEDMLDFTLHGWDVVAALGLRRPHLVGHSMGGMIAAEMAAVAPGDLDRLVLVAAAGLWIEAHPIPDIFALLPAQLVELLFQDPERGQQLLTGGVDFSDMEAFKNFYLGQQRRLAMAGKILFPIPNRRVSKRLYRVTAKTLVLWGAADRLIVPAYACPHALTAHVPRTAGANGQPSRP